MTGTAGIWPAVLSRPRRRWMAQLVANGLVQAALAAAAGWCIHEALRAATEAPSAPLAWPLAGLAASTLALYGLRAVERRDAQRLGQHFAGEVRERLFDVLLSLQPAQFAAMTRGALTQRLVGDLRALRMWVSLGLARCAVGATAGLGLLALLTLAHPLLALAVGAAAAAVMVAAFSAGPIVRRAVRAERRRAVRLGANVNERVRHLDKLIAAGRRNREQNRLRRLHDHHTDAAVKLSWQLALLRYSGDLAASAAGLALLATGSLLVAAGELAPLALASWMIVAGMMLPALRETGLAIAHLQGARVSRERVLAFLARAAQAPTAAMAETTASARGIDFDRVQLIAGAEPLTARVEPGQVAIVVSDAPSLARHLLAVTAWLAPPASGTVLIDGRPLAQWPIDALRQHLRLVDSDAPLWRGTLEYNLRYLAPHARERSLARAIERCGLAGWLASLPQGLATRIQEGGANLAPERRFQVALAAALLARPSVLLVDDSRVALPPDAEQALEQALAAFASRGGSVLRFTCRDSARAAADVRLQLDCGVTDRQQVRRDSAWLH